MRNNVLVANLGMQVIANKGKTVSTNTNAVGSGHSNRNRCKEGDDRFLHLCDCYDVGLDMKISGKEIKAY